MEGKFTLPVVRVPPLTAQAVLAELKQQNLFGRTNKADRIAMAAVYLPIIREEIYAFVRMWNAHSMRKQKGRPNVVVGRPNMLYWHPGDHVENFGTPYDEQTWSAADRELGEWDVDAVFPPETQAWCTRQLEEIGFNPLCARLDDASERDAPFRDVYLAMRTKAQEHILSYAAPTLELIKNPIGAFDWVVCSYDTSVKGILIEYSQKITLSVLRAYERVN